MFKTMREARLNLNVNYLCYALRALFWTLIIINWTLIISLIFILVLFDKLLFESLFPYCHLLHSSSTLVGRPLALKAPMS